MFNVKTFRTVSMVFVSTNMTIIVVKSNPKSLDIIAPLTDQQTLNVLTSHLFHHWLQQSVVLDMTDQKEIMTEVVLPVSISTIIIIMIKHAALSLKTKSSVGKVKNVWTENVLTLITVRELNVKQEEDVWAVSVLKWEAIVS